MWREVSAPSGSDMVNVSEYLDLTAVLKFVFFEKATKFDEISILLLTNKFVFFVSRYSFELQSLFVWFSVLKLNSLRWLLVYKLSQCLKHSKHCQNLAMFGMFE